MHSYDSCIAVVDDIFLFHISLNQFERDRLNSSRAKFKGYLLIGSWGEAMAFNIIFKLIIQNNNLRY